MEIFKSNKIGEKIKFKGYTHIVSNVMIKIILLRNLFTKNKTNCLGICTRNQYLLPTLKIDPSVIAVINSYNIIL